MLIVEDDLLLLKYISRDLSEMTKEIVFEADSAETALDIWRENKASIRMLITDCSLPGMNGDSLALKMREEDENLRILFISGKPPSAMSEVPLRQGDNFLQKPFKPEELKLALNRFLQG